MKTHAFHTLVFSVALFLGTASSFAAYSVHTKIETLEGKVKYTWTVYNQDQSWGLDGFVIEVPEETQVMNYTVPPSYSTEDGTGYWIMEERTKEMVDPHDDRVVFPKAKLGMKWLSWAGRESPSVYPAGTSATFTLTTDSTVQPASINSVTVTYTPQNNPHYYDHFEGNVTGPGIVVAKTAKSQKTFPNLQTYSVFGRTSDNVVANLNGPATVGLTSTNAQDPEPRINIDLHAGITVEGVVGRKYAISFTDDLKGTNWQTLDSFTLSAPKELWFDPKPATQQQRFYKVTLEPSP